jgi:hypothetical protein
MLLGMLMMAMMQGIKLKLLIVHNIRKSGAEKTKPLNRQ